MLEIQLGTDLPGRAGGEGGVALVIQRPVAGGDHQPGGWFGGHAVRGPGFEGGHPRILGQILGEAHVAHRLPYSARPSKWRTGSAARSTPSRQRTLMAVIGVPSGIAPSPSGWMPHSGQKRCLMRAGPKV